MSPDPSSTLSELFDQQRAAFLAQPMVGRPERIDRLTRAIDLLVSNQQRICAALATDFGQRPAELSRFMDVYPAVHALKFARRHLRRWLRPRYQRLGLPMGVPGARGRVQCQPLGVVGVVSPWNFPIGLTFGPLAGILAAGNRCLLKPSEFTPCVSALLQEEVARRFDARELAVVTGGAQVAQQFVSLPFDHLLFTGSTHVGRDVMLAAAAHLVPVTLELGGKCPVIIGSDADLARAVDRIMMSKLANAGQMCLAPDHVWLPQTAVAAFVALARRWTQRAYPGLPQSPDFTALITQRHVERIASLLADARDKGAEVIALGTAGGGMQAARLVAPALVLSATQDMRIMQEEIFGPVLPILGYERIDEAIGQINRGQRPLALYYFGQDRQEEAEVIARTCSGGVTINDVALHYLAEELPFGGVGASGIGAYHGEYGFRRFSHERAILRSSPFDFAGAVGLRPPYSARLRRALSLLIRR